MKFLRRHRRLKWLVLLILAAVLAASSTFATDGKSIPEVLGQIVLSSDLVSKLVGMVILLNCWQVKRSFTHEKDIQRCNDKIDCLAEAVKTCPCGNARS